MSARERVNEKLRQRAADMLEVMGDGQQLIPWTRADRIRFLIALVLFWVAVVGGIVWGAVWWWRQ
jgi:hypothetical protein